MAGQPPIGHLAVLECGCLARAEQQDSTVTLFRVERISWKFEDTHTDGEVVAVVVSSWVDAREDVKPRRVSPFKTPTPTRSDDEDGGATL